MYQEFNKIYDNPEAYNFDPEKKTKFLIKDERLKNEGGVYPTHGYMFWNDVRPVSLLHHYLVAP
ncbi:hypothetical protein [Candidatus Coxiella mudrowiae]|uniref:hypothetical protein n=1 Tax=Candidatus Coxiella mudrowiae TaxID=2054173 RepID=UPI000C2867D8|nr:hypothetical protein [Candidatus Coxiella mudrowiae]